MNSCKKHHHAVETTRLQISLKQGAKVGDGCLISWKFDQDACRKALARMIVIDELPFKFVEGEGFRSFMAMVCPRFIIPSRWTVARDCVDLYTSEKKNLKSLLNKSSQRVCLTTDTWTSIQNINYMCLTAHFIDKNWKLQKRIINFCPITSHKGEAISLAIENCLRDWGIDRIFTITVDNASSNDVAINNFRRKMANWDSTILKRDHIHMRCVAHIINLIVVDGLKDISESVTRVRDAVKYVKQSPARLNKFKECAKLEKIESKSSLCLDVSTRWNSTFLMLNVAQKFERAFERFDEEDPYFKLDLQCKKWEVIVNDDGSVIFGSDGKPQKEMKTCDGRPTSTDWNNARLFASLLQVFYEITLKVSGSLYITANTFAHDISSIHTILKEWQESEDIDVYSMGARMKKKFDKYWGDPDKMNKLFYIAVVLDPRHKLDFVEFMLVELYGVENGARVGKMVKDTLVALYKNYKEKMEPSSSNMLSIQEPSEIEPKTLSQTDLKRQSILEKYKRQKAQSFGDGSMSELDKYLNEMVEEYHDSFDILGWWKQNCHRFPILAQIARDVLAIPISTVASESAFSTGGRVLDCFRSSLTPMVVESLICTQDWLRSSPIPINVEETLEDLEKLERGNFVFKKFIVIFFLSS
ncbi:zinc finger BED domain-containing protein RICESLEEPER 2-like [Dorcoceras hygrometricum]|uniref:Zinc finger BED domain-containing protein RICESLEEPER 2-like n=1 Tax=Dorcoceras hygrometricum TaxID=472368 RepID=A0A2Z7C537_9LAMI|nr:zinc finger BED domain-containing protein RICESLEEPER 2-like [Dorcoceras hygrometricum]